MVHGLPSVCNYARAEMYLHLGEIKGFVNLCKYKTKKSGVSDQ